MAQPGALMRSCEYLLGVARNDQPRITRHTISNYVAYMSRVIKTLLRIMPPEVRRDLKIFMECARNNQLEARRAFRNERWRPSPQRIALLENHRMTDAALLRCRAEAVQRAMQIMAELEGLDCDPAGGPNPVTGNPTMWHLGRVLLEPQENAVVVPRLYSVELVDELMGYVATAMLFALRVTRIELVAHISFDDIQQHPRYRGAGLPPELRDGASLFARVDHLGEGQLHMGVSWAHQYTKRGAVNGPPAHARTLRPPECQWNALHPDVYGMLWRYYRLIGTGVTAESRRQVLFFVVQHAVNSGPITAQERVPIYLGTHSRGRWSDNGFPGLWRRTMERVPMWNAARMWQVHNHYDPNVRRWDINFVVFRALMITATGEQWQRGEGPFSHIPLNERPRFLNELAWQAHTSVHYLLANYLGTTLVDDTQLDLASTPAAVADQDDGGPAPGVPAALPPHALALADEVADEGEPNAGVGEDVENNEEGAQAQHLGDELEGAQGLIALALADEVADEGDPNAGGGGAQAQHVGDELEGAQEGPPESSDSR